MVPEKKAYWALYEVVIQTLQNIAGGNVLCMQRPILSHWSQVGDMWDTVI